MPVKTEPCFIAGSNAATCHPYAKRLNLALPFSAVPIG